MTDAEKSCDNCAHQRAFRSCGRTGWQCETELTYGGRCAEGKLGTSLRLWKQRPTALQRIIGIFYAAKSAPAPTEPKES